MGNFFGLTTSQNATAPKHNLPAKNRPKCLTTSQNATAPKLAMYSLKRSIRLTTSQNATAPKRIGVHVWDKQV